MNVERWRPAGDDEGAEFAFLLRLLPSHEREDVLKMRLVMDKKRALVSRLLQRAACARVAGIAWPDVVIARTRGRKPFLANAIALPHAPNFNFNVSHEGDFVVLASEPVAMCGVDVAAPGQARRPRADGRVPTADEMLATFGAVLTERGDPSSAAPPGAAAAATTTPSRRPSRNTGARRRRSSRPWA